jgi:hypothetical protein
MRYRIGEAIHPTSRVAPGQEPTSEQIDALDERVRAALQAELTQLEREESRGSAAADGPRKHVAHPTSEAA